MANVYGSFNMTTTNQYVVGKIDWVATSNIEGNYSDFYCEMRMWRTNTGYTTWGTGNFYITVDGTQTSATNKYIELTYNSNTLVMTASKRIYHNSDGSKSITVAWSGGLSVFTINASSGTAYLETIPRASTPTTSPTSAIMGTTTVTINTNKLAGFTHTIRYVFGASSGTIASNVVDSTSWTPPIGLCSEVPNSTSGTCTIYCDTYSGATLVGTKSVNLTLTVPTSVVPTVTSITSSELVSAVTTVMGAMANKYVNNLSNIRFTINGATGAYGSTISSYKINFNSIDHTGSSTWDSGVISLTGASYVATATVTDSRGRVSANKTVTVTIMPYTPPTISSFSVVRALSDGTENDLGTYAKIVRNGNVQSLINSTEKNTLTCKVEFKLRSASTWTVLNTGADAVFSVTNSATLTTALTRTASTVTFPISNAYDFRLTLTDKFNTAISDLIMPVGTTAMALGDDGISVGKVWNPADSAVLQVGGGASIDGRLDLVSGNKTSIGTSRIYNNVQQYNTNTGSVTGICKITLPVAWTSTMMTISISGYNYNDTTGAWNLQLGGYNYSTTQEWNGVSATLDSMAPFNKVRFAYDGSKCCILLGTTTTVWAYPRMIIDQVVTSFGGYDGFDTGWGISFITSETGITKIEEAKIASYENSIYGDNPAGVVATTDANAIWKSGFYEMNGGSNNPHGSGWLWLLNMGHSADNSSYKFGGQIGIDINNGYLYHRSKDQAGVGTWKRATDAGEFFNSKNTTGYQALPNGLLIQWGSTFGSKTQSFPTSFGTCFFVSTIGALNMESDPVYSCLSSADNWSATGFQVSSWGYMNLGPAGTALGSTYYRNIVGASNFGGTSYWIAIGTQYGS